MQSFLEDMRLAGAGVGKASPLLGRPSPMLGTKLGRPSPLLGTTLGRPRIPNAVYYMVRVTVEDDDGNKVLTTVQAYRGWDSLRRSYKQFDSASAALTKAEREAGYTEVRGVFNIVSSEFYDLPRGFGNYAEYAEHLKRNPKLNTIYSAALKQCKELGKQRQGNTFGTLVLQCEESFPGAELSDGVYTHQFRTIQSFRTSELFSGENHTFTLNRADREHLGEAIIEAQESQLGRGLELKSCINGKASGFLLFNDLEEAKRSYKRWFRRGNNIDSL